MAARTAADPAAPNYQEAFAQLAVAMHGLVGSQTQFIRSAADADPSIGTSLSTPLLPSEVLEAQEIDNTVEDNHRNGLPAARRDHRPLMPNDYVFDPDDNDYDATDHRHGTDWGHGHDEVTLERADQLSAWQRTRLRFPPPPLLSRGTILYYAAAREHARPFQSRWQKLRIGLRKR